MLNSCYKLALKCEYCANIKLLTKKHKTDNNFQ